ncbi:hypothetical protein AAG587_14515 [Vreelandella neptunia]|uniref:hypothetical protein n=1 Tax=Vreelandella neptunia TaxID=115551 RepID=UPI003159D61E
MEIEVSDWIAIAALATSFIAYVEMKKANKNNDSIVVLKDILEASEKTHVYLYDRSQGKDRDYRKEMEIAHLWSSAAFLISRIDKELSVRLHAKSEFWMNQDTWDVDIRAHKDISLDSVTADARRLIEAYT